MNDLNDDLSGLRRALTSPVTWFLVVLSWLAVDGAIDVGTRVVEFIGGLFK